MKQILKQIIPSFLLKHLKRIIIQRKEKKFKHLSLKTTFNKIYKENLWGKPLDENNIFFSGPGTHNEQISSIYVDKVKKFLLTFPKKPDVVDLGCGDFIIGNQLRKHCGKYIALDIVAELINFNKVKYKNLNVDFQISDITENEPPKADVVFIRQVLQHLSNHHIKKIIYYLNKKYKYLILTEDLPNNHSFVPNADKTSSSEIRHNSGVILTDYPFNLKIKESKCICKIKNGVSGRIIVTNLYKLME